MPHTISDLATLVGGKLIGDGAAAISKVASLQAAVAGDISFVEKAPAPGLSLQSGASCLLIPEGIDAATLPCVAIEVKNPKFAFASIAAVLHAWPRKTGIGANADLHESATVGSDVYVAASASVGARSKIGAGTQVADGVRIGDDVQIGEGCFIFPNVVIYGHVAIGDRCIIHAGAVIGADGFGFLRGRTGYVKFPQIGTVVIEDDVEIGANSCVDRGALGETRIGSGTKIDNLVQVAHNVQIGQRVVIAAQTGISGSTVIESDCVIGGQVGLGDHCRVKTGAMIGSQAGILPGKIVRAGVWWGTPVQPLADFKRMNARMKNLSDMNDQLQELRIEMDRMKTAISRQD